MSELVDTSINYGTAALWLCGLTCRDLYVTVLYASQCLLSVAPFYVEVNGGKRPAIPKF